MDYVVRKAHEGDNLNIAKTLTYSFEKVLSVLTKDMERIANAFGNGIVTERFYVAEQDGEIIDICVKNGDIAEFGQVLFKMI